MGAVCHEIRNLCGAISVVHARLARTGAVAGDDDLRTLAALVGGLGRMAGIELGQSSQPAVLSVDLDAVLEDLRIVIEPAFREDEIAIHWDIPAVLPHVSAQTGKRCCKCCSISPGTAAARCKIPDHASSSSKCRRRTTAWSSA